MARAPFNADIKRFYEEGGYIRRKESAKERRDRIRMALYGSSRMNFREMAEGGLTGLLKAIRNTGGARGAERLERAADSVDLSRYNLDALSEAFDKRNPGLVTIMRPSEFEKYAWPLPQKWIEQVPYQGSQAGLNQWGGTYDEYIRSLQDVARQGGGFDQTPALWFGQSKVPGYTGDYRVVAGHDGRHRMRALAGMGDDPTLVNLLPQQIGALGRQTAARRMTPSYFGSQLFPEVMPQTYSAADKSTWLPVELPEDLFARGGRAGFADGGALTKLLKSFRDAPSKLIDDWRWRPAADVAAEVPREVPGHVLKYGDFMRAMSNRAGQQGFDPRDPLKAYTTTLSSIQRQAINRDKLAGLPLTSTEQMIRPEGAFSDWLGTKAGQRYLARGAEGEADPEAIADMARHLQPFGLMPTLTERMTEAPGLIAGKEGRLSELVDRASRGASDPGEWREAVSDLPGIGPAKAGFMASLLGRGDIPTLDARQVILHTGQPTSASKPFLGKANRATEGVDRLAARQSAFGLTLPPEYDPYYQHLAHHTIWDAVGNEQTTHSDLIDAMLNRARGGRIGYAGGGRLAKFIEENLLNRAAKMRGETPEDTSKLLETTVEGVKGAPRTQTGLSARKGTAPFEDVTARIEPSPFTPPPRELTPESFPMGSYIVGTMSDLAAAGPKVHGLNGVRFKTPVELGGGSDFPYWQRYYNQPDSLWAAGKVPLITMNNALRAAGATGDSDIFFMNKLMGQRAVDQSNMSMAMVEQMLRNSDLSKKDASQLTQMVRDYKTSFIDPVRSKQLGRMVTKYDSPMPDFPHVNDENLHDYLMGLPMGQRAGVMKVFDKADAQKLGAPNPAAIRLVINDPALFGTQRGDVGRTVGRINLDDPLITDPVKEHPSYPVHQPGEAIGGMDRPVPGEIMFPDRWTQLRKQYAKQGPGTQMSKFMNDPAIQKVTPEWLDTIMPYYETLQRGWSPSGLAHGGRTAFGRGGAVCDSDDPTCDQLRFHTMWWQKDWGHE